MGRALSCPWRSRFCHRAVRPVLAEAGRGRTGAACRGDFVLLPSAPAFEMVSRPGARCAPGQPSATEIRHGEPEGEPDFHMLGGSFRLNPVNAPLLVALLPKIIHISAANGATGRLASVIDLIMEECAADRPGRDMILERLLEVLLMECLRWPGAAASALPAGLLAGMQDAALARALSALHGEISAGWTVAELARLAGMSRSAFAARFSAAVGCAPMEYLARWRMTLAKDTLSRGGTPLDRLAGDIGYEIRQRLQHRLSPPRRLRSRRIRPRPS